MQPFSIDRGLKSVFLVTDLNDINKVMNRRLKRKISKELFISVQEYF